jgi:Ca2+-binding RTX toxin-like protein
VLGGDGNDNVNGDDGNDWVQGDDDNDVAGNDIVRGGNGNDVVLGMQGTDWMYGDAGNDQLFDHINNIGTGNDLFFGGAGNDELFSYDGIDALDGGSGTDLLSFRNVDGRLTQAGIELHGGSGIDTLEIEFAPGTVTTLIGLPVPIDGIEILDIEDKASTRWTLSFEDIRDMSDTNRLTIDGNTGDRISLDNFAETNLSGGEWVQGVTQTTADPTESYAHYDYFRSGEVWASVSIDTDIQVWLV